MKNTSILLLFLALSLFAVSIQAATDKGAISGVINHCKRGGIAGMMVYIPGKPHLVITGTNGKFILDNVDAGDHTLYFMLNGNIMNYNKWVDVTAGNTSRLGEIHFCDNITAGMQDKKAMPAEMAKPPESDARLISAGECRSAADGTGIRVSNGNGHCQGGQPVIDQCNKGFADCDKKAVNGCEIDIMSNDEHCGACFNACADLESCQLGFC